MSEHSTNAHRAGTRPPPSERAGDRCATRRRHAGAARRTRGKGEAAQPAGRRLARPAAQAAVLDLRGVHSALRGDGRLPVAVHLRRPDRAALSRSRVEPSRRCWFGYDVLGRDVYARTIYGARASIVVALLSVIGTMLIGGTMGIIAGYNGGWVDGLLSRIADIFFGLPFVLGAIVILTTFNGAGSSNTTWDHGSGRSSSLVVLSWPVVDADHALLGAGHQGGRLHRGRPGAGCRHRPDHLQAPAAELPGAAAGVRDDHGRRRSSARRPPCPSWASA